MRKILTAVAVVIMMSVLTIPVNAADNVKIGFVDFQKALNESKAGVAAKAELEKEGEKLAKDLEAKQGELKKLNEELEKKKSVWSQEVLESKVQAFQEKLARFQDEAGQKRNELNRKKTDSEEQIIVDLKDVVADIAEKKGFTIILEKSAGGVLYFNAEDDITSLVIQAYDKSYRKKK